MELFREPNIQFMRYRKYWVVASAALLLLAVFALFVHGKLNLGIDFAGGTQVTLKLSERPEIDEIRDLAISVGISDAQIQRFGDDEDNEVLVKTPTVTGSEEGSREALVQALESAFNPDSGGRLDLNQRGRDAVAELLLARDPERLRAADEATARGRYEQVADAILSARRESGLIESWDRLEALPEVGAEVLEALREGAFLGRFAVLGSENVGPQIGSELRRKGILAVVFSLLGMLGYITFRFELRFGIGALVATFHDVMITLGLYALAGYEFNLTTIAAFLTLIGYSVNDTVVVFDRVRENLRRRRTEPLEETMNRSLNQTLSRTVLTSGTTLLAVGSLLFLGGDVLRGFAFILTVGIVVGTYSSIYVASPFTIYWEQVFGREGRLRRGPAA